MVLVRQGFCTRLIPSGTASAAVQPDGSIHVVVVTSKLTDVRAGGELLISHSGSLNRKIPTESFWIELRIELPESGS